jgi:hypothetical protein
LEHVCAVSVVECGLKNALNALFSDKGLADEIANSCESGLSEVPFDLVTGPEIRSEIAALYRAGLQEEIEGISASPSL